MPLFARVFARDFNPDYRRLWLASATTNLGDGVLGATGPLLVASLTSEPGLVGLAVLVQQLPWLLFGLLSGALVDRWDRRRLIAVVDVCRAVAMAVLTLTIVTGQVNLVVAYVALFLLGAGETLADGAVGGLVVLTVPAERLGDANARLMATTIIGNQLAGPPLGAFLFALGHAYPSAFQAITYAATAILLARLTVRQPRAGRSPAGKTSVWADIIAGLRWLNRRPALRLLVATGGVMNLTFMLGFATWVLYATEVLGLSAFGFGLLATCSAVGGLAGPWVYRRIEPILGAVGVLRIGLCFEAIVHLVLAAHPGGVWVVAPTMALFGTHSIMFGAAETTVSQRVTPFELLGRVNSVRQFVSLGVVPIGGALGALIAQKLNLTTGFWIAGAAMLVVAAVAWRPLAVLRPD
ncbi:MFS transporter [Flindersiella endophytica]